jgi:4-amino-4-deoxy-L-arabinose transferase-like glycosyltransferase
MIRATNEVMSRARPLIVNGLPTVVVLCAFALRAQGFTWGLPYQLHPDEPVLFLAAQQLLRTGALEGLSFAEVYKTAIGYPPLYIRWLVMQQAVLIALAGAPFPQMVYFAFSRLLNVAVGAAAAALVYRLALDVGGKGAATLAAAWVAVNPTLVQHARFATPDTPVTLLVLLTLIVACKARWRGSAWLGQGAVICGLVAVTMKYQAAPILAVALYALLRAEQRGLARSAAHLGLAALLIGGVFGLLLTRFHMLELVHAPGQPTASFFQKDNPLALVGLRGNLGAFLQGVGTINLGVALVGLTLLNLSGLNKSRTSREGAWMVAAFALLLMAELSLFRFDNIRQLLPAIAATGVLWGSGLWGLADLVARKLAVLAPRYFVDAGSLAVKLAAAIVVAGAALLLTPRVVLVAREGWLLTHKDTRAITADWFNANAPDGSGIALEYDNVEFIPEYGGFPGTKRFKAIVVDSLFDLSYDDYRAAGIQYLVADSRSARHGGYFSDPDNPKFREWVRPLKEISNEANPGPRRIIFELK